MSTKKVDIDVKVNSDHTQAAAAEQAIDRVNAAASKHTTATAASTKAVNGLSGSMKSLTDQSGKASAGIGLAAAASSGSIHGITAAVAGLSKAFGPLTLIVSTFFAAWQVGLKAQAWLWKTFVGEVKTLEPVLFKTRKEFDELNKVKLDTLAAEISDIQEQANAVLSAIDKANARSAALRNAKAAAEKARILAEEPEGPARDLKIAAIDKRTAETDIADRENAARQKLEEMRKKEAAIQERIAAAEAADRELQEKAERAKARWEDRPTGTTAKVARNARSAAASSASSLEELRDQLTPQLTAAREGQADAQTQLQVIPLERAALGSTYSATTSAIGQKQAEAQRKAKAQQTREALQAQLAAKQAEAETLPDQMMVDQLSAAATAEQADVAQADQAIDQFKSTTRYAPQSHSYQSQLRELESIRQKEQQEAEQAVATARATAQALGQALRSITTEIENLKSQMSNLEN